jgi:CheY-like chemotaxis protein
VTDTGIGIPEDRVQDLFRSFHQLENDYSKRYQGTGLGLYISKALVEKMGGTIGVLSEVGKGSRFHFDLPWGRVEATRAEASEPMAAASEGPPLSILLAEDERLNRMHLVFGLERAGHRVAAVENGRKALGALEAEAFDVVLMDIQMPEMDGVEETRRIRSAQGGGIDPSVPIVALSAYVTEKDRESFAEAGMDAYVAKPVEMTELIRVVREVVGANAAVTGSLL